MVASHDASSGAADELHGFSVVRGLPHAARRVFVSFGVAAIVVLALLIAVSVLGSRMIEAGQSTSAERLEVIVGNEVIAVPENMIRHANQRSSGVAERIDLQVYWPEKSGFHHHLTKAFAETDPDLTQMVLVSVVKRQWLLDMAARFEPVYSKAKDQAALVRTQFGLEFVRLKPALGYVDEVLVYAPPGAYEARPRFIARCNEPATGRSTLMLGCEMDVFFGENLEAKVRFPAAFLENWQNFSPELQLFLSGLMALPDPAS